MVDLTKRPDRLPVGVRDGFLSEFFIRHQPVPQLPLGIRSNNPGNIEKNERNAWEGKLTADEMTEEQREGRFEVFKTEEHGIRALVKTLHTYERQYGL